MFLVLGMAGPGRSHWALPSGGAKQDMMHPKNMQSADGGSERGGVREMRRAALYFWGSRKDAQMRCYVNGVLEVRKEKGRGVEAGRVGNTISKVLRLEHDGALEK